MMYQRKENPPHVHAIREWHGVEAKVRISDGEVFVGTLRPTDRRRVRKFVVENRDMLMTRWDELQRRR